MDKVAIGKPAGLQDLSTCGSLPRVNVPGEVDLSGARFRKSSQSFANGNCVEVAFIPGGTVVRDSKDPSGPVLLVTEAHWRGFIGKIQSGSYDSR